MFTDIVGSTAFFEAKGDIEGLALVHRHNEMLFPLVEQHRGEIIKTIGDAIMATFALPEHAVACAVAMQRRLAAASDEPDPIRIRIGVHAGRVLRDDGDVFGDTVNTAARVESAAGAGEVLISQAVFDRLPSPKPRVVRRDTVPFKGKAEPMDVMAIDTGAVRPLTEGRLLTLELRQGPDGLRVGWRDVDEATVSARLSSGLTPDKAQSIIGGLEALFATSNGPSAYRTELLHRGKRLAEAALTVDGVARLKAEPPQFVLLDLDEEWIAEPWELMVPDKAPLGLSCGVGRVVSVEGAVRQDPVAPSGRAVVIADPDGTLEHAAAEGRVIAGLLQERGVDEVELLTGAVDADTLVSRTRGAAFVHYAGHAQVTEQGTELVLAGGSLTVRDWADRLAGAVPAFVFVNACRSSGGQGYRDQSRGTAHGAGALLAAGVRHHLAPAFAVPDDDATFFAARVYEDLLDGQPVGEAVRAARQAAADQQHASLAFAAYVLYGDPRTALFAARPAQKRASLRAVSGEQVRLPRTGTAHVLPAPKPFPVFAVAAGALVLVALTLVAVLVSGEGPAPSPADPPPVVGGAPVTPPSPPVTAKVAHTGDVRVSVLPFKTVGEADQAAALGEGLAEALTTGLAGAPGMALIERGQIDVDLGEIEFSQSKYVDPATRAQLGKIKGAEIAVLGAVQRAGAQLRVTARFVDVETGKIIEQVVTTGEAADVFGLQDAVTARVKEKLGPVVQGARP